MINHTKVSLNKRTTFIFIMLFSIILVLDSLIVDFSAYSGVRIPTWLNITIFITFSVLFVASSTILLNTMWRGGSIKAYKPATLFDHISFHIIIISIQIITIVILMTINLQMIFFDKYSLFLLNVQSYVSHLSALIFSSLLVFLFARWLPSANQNYVIVLYALSFVLVSCNLVVSLVYLEFYFTGINATLPDIKPYPISRYVTNSPASHLTATLSVVTDAISAASFLLMWIATAILLSQYRLRMGKARYFLLMSIPLIYYIFPFQGYFGDILFPLIISSPIAISMIYVLLFSATKQVGALLFSLSFWTASSLVHDDRIRRPLLMSTIGMTILFGSLENSALQYHVYPPYGFITEAFLPIGSYLLFVGIFNSAKHISQDAELRREIYKNATSQLSLLRTIGVSQMEKELQGKINSLQKHYGALRTENEFPELEEKEVKQILHEVLHELYYSKNDKEEIQS
jgi:hypothetical protein